MNFGFTEEQELLRDQVRRFMQDACPLTEVRKLMKSTAGTSPSLWRQAAELGWLGLIIPERFGGIGLKWVDLTVVLEETGRGLCPLPIISQTLAAAALLRCGSDAQKQKLLPALADGSRVGTLALYDEPNWVHPDSVKLTLDGGRLKGTKPFVADAGAADLFIVACRTGSGLQTRHRRSQRAGRKRRGATDDGRDEAHRYVDARRCAERRTTDAADHRRPRLPVRLRRGCGHGRVGRRRRSRARDDDRVREGTHPVRQPDRQVPRREAPARRDVRRHRIVQVAVRTTPRGPWTTRRSNSPARRRWRRRTPAMRSRASASTACNCTAPSASPPNTTFSCF